jgi:putative oxidoreductase
MIHYLMSLANPLAQWQWIGALISRISVGLLFFLSGGGKLFSQERRVKMRETIRQAGLPAPILSATIISLIEFFFGGLLSVGFLTPICCIMLIGVIFGVLTTMILPQVKAKSFFDWLSQFLYLPEVLYVVILIWLLLSGPTRSSVDQLWFSR